ncbi:MAG: DUF805 domain-containing protein [Mycetocola sp.]
MADPTDTSSVTEPTTVNTVLSAEDTEPLRGASIAQALKRTLWTRAYQLRGRASLSEFWWWMLVNAGVVVVLAGIIPHLLGAPSGQASIGPVGSFIFSDIALFGWGTFPEQTTPPAAMAALVIASLWGVLTLVPSITVAARRMHDSDLSAVWLFLVLLPFGAFVLLFLLARSPRIEGTRFDA